MDVTAPHPPGAAPPAGHRPDSDPPPVGARGRPSALIPPRSAEATFRPPSTLKFGLTAADVDARFAIHEATNTVTVTMYDRTTGEVLREVPSRPVLDVIAALASTGLRVDELR